MDRLRAGQRIGRRSPSPSRSILPRKTSSGSDSRGPSTRRPMRWNQESPPQAAPPGMARVSASRSSKYRAPCETDRVELVAAACACPHKPLMGATGLEHPPRIPRETPVCDSRGAKSGAPPGDSAPEPPADHRPAGDADRSTAGTDVEPDSGPATGPADSPRPDSGPTDDPDLAAVVAAWATLPEPIRRAVLALVAVPNPRE